jgi:hypothetical protein
MSLPTRIITAMFNIKKKINTIIIKGAYLISKITFIIWMGVIYFYYMIKVFGKNITFNQI